MSKRLTDTQVITHCIGVFSALIESATEAERLNGFNWYRNANQTVNRLAAAYGHTPDTVAYVIALLSPLCRWSQNIYAAKMVFEGNLSEAMRHCLPLNVLKARRYLEAGEDTLSGSKVTAFYRNLLLDVEITTIDSWMLRAAGFKHTTPRRVRCANHALLTIANRHKIAGYQAQAIAWNRIRSQHGHKLYS